MALSKFKLRIKLQDDQQPVCSIQNYTLSDLEDAVERAKTTSYRKAGKENDFGVQKIPKSTIWDASQKKYKTHKKGVEKSLSADETCSLRNYVKYMSARGFAFTCKILATFVVAIIKQSGRPTRMNLQMGPSKK